MSLYKFMGFIIGMHSHDYHTFILIRKKKDLKIRKYPKTIGISTAILKDLIDHKTKVIIVKVDGIPMFKTTPDTWLQKGIIDKLSPDQDPHAFLHLIDFENMKPNSNILSNKEDIEDNNLDNFITKIIQE